jgi:uncharacterized membrane protein YdjX (TVP38/TMEM64 family)
MGRGNLFRRKLLLLAIVLVVAAMIVASDTLHARSGQIIALVESVITQYPTLGMLCFVVLAMVSAMLAFFSSAIIVPVGVYAWGSVNCFVLLWAGWLLGGITSFWIGRAFGRPVAATLVGEKRLASFDTKVGRQTRFSHVLLFQAALPSEIPGYVLGTSRYPFVRYLMALALVELPYAVATVYLGASFVEREAGRFILAGVAAVLVPTGLYALYRQRTLHRGPTGA